MRMILAGLMVMTAVPAVQAASFDCAKASSFVEKAICDAPELDHLDTVLAKAYATAQGGLSEAASKTVLAGQREWIDFAELACSKDAKPFTAALDDDQKACLATGYRNRLTELSQSRMEGEWRFYPKTSYDVVDDPDPQIYQSVATKRMISPRIDDTGAVAAKFNALMDEMDAANAFDRNEPDYQTSDSETETEVVSVGSNRISLSTNASWFGHGAAHGNFNITYTHFLTDKGRTLEASDLFTGKGWEEALGKMVLDELNRTIDGGMFPDSEKEALRYAIDPTRWNLTDYALEVLFQPYEVAPYAMGTPTARIGWDMLNEYLSDDYSSIVY